MTRLITAALLMLVTGSATSAQSLCPDPVSDKAIPGKPATLIFCHTMKQEDGQPTTIESAKVAFDGVEVLVQAPTVVAATAAETKLTIGTVTFPDRAVDLALSVAHVTADETKWSTPLTARISPTCEIAIEPQASPLPAEGGSGTLGVLTNGPGCAWSTSTSDPSWLLATPPTGVGPGTVTYIAVANVTGVYRADALRVTHGASGTIASTMIGQEAGAIQPPPPGDTTAPDIYDVSVVRSGKSANHTVYARTHAIDVAEVRFLLDGREFNRQTCCAGQVLWTAKAYIATSGTHRITVAMRDASGNSGNAEISVLR